jgi:hypothetical protein
VARIEGGALERDLEPVSADDAIEAAADRLHKYAPRRTVEWDRTLRKVTVRAESRRFELLLSRRLYTLRKYRARGSLLVRVRRGPHHMLCETMTSAPIYSPIVEAPADASGEVVDSTSGRCHQPELAVRCGAEAPRRPSGTRHDRCRLAEQGRRDYLIPP